MPPVTILDTPQITVWYHADKKMIHHKMHQYAHGKDFRDALMAGVDAMKKHGATKWLSDDRANPVMTPEDQKWSVDVWQAQVMNAGWKHWALVEPQGVLAKMRMEQFTERFSKRGVTVKVFTDPDEAMRWLAGQ